MIQATAQNQKSLPDGTPVNAPTELQLSWLMDKWGVGVLGSEPDFFTVVKANRALAIYEAFRKDMKDRTDADWTIIKNTLSVIEGWKS